MATETQNGNDFCDGPRPSYSPEEQKARDETKLLVLEGLSDILEDAWFQSDESHKKKIIRQLLLKWHPDKNVDDDEELATAATQHIQAEAERLEQGLPRHGANQQFQTSQSGFDPRNPFATSPTFQKYFDDAYKQYYDQIGKRRREQAERDRYRSNLRSRPNFSYSKGHSSASSSTKPKTNGAQSAPNYPKSEPYTNGAHSSSSGSQSKNSSAHGSRSSSADSASSRSTFSNEPHPSSSYNNTEPSANKVTKLFKQAREDLRSADNDYDATQPAYEWVCFKAHQSAEKALKAVTLSKTNTKSFSHDLASLAAIARDEELKRTATKLQSIIGDNNKLYNLVFVDFDVIPHEAITREMACDAMMCARDILDRVKDIENLEE